MQRPAAASDQDHKPASDAELTQQYRAIGSAAILAALACRMKKAQAEDDAGKARKRDRRAA